MRSRGFRPAIPILWLVAASACGDAEPDEKSPAYARAAPTYARTRPADEIPAIPLIDVTREAAIDFVHETGAFGEKWMPETMGSGAAFVDYDGDDLPDLFLVNSAEWPGHESRQQPVHSHLYRNLGGGRFDDVSQETGIAAATAGLYGMAWPPPTMMRTAIPTCI